MVYDCGYAVAYFDRNGLGLQFVFAHTESHHARSAVELTGGIEDEIADAIINLFAQKLLDGLQCMGVMTYQCIGPGTYQLVSVPSLTTDGPKRVLAPPV